MSIGFGIAVAGFVCGWILWRGVLHPNNGTDPDLSSKAKPLSPVTVTSKHPATSPDNAGTSLTAKANDGALIKDPRAAGYSGIKLLRSGALQPAEIFSREPRKEPWASEREREMTDYAHDDIVRLDPKATVKVECRTSICRTTITSDNPYLTAQFGSYPFGCGGSMTTGELELTNEHGETYADLYEVWADESISPETFRAMRDRWCPAERSKFLQAAAKPFVRE